MRPGTPRPARPTRRRWPSPARCPLKTPDVYWPYLAQTLNNLGLLSTAEHRTTEARKNFDEALALCRALAVRAPDLYRPYVAQTLNNLGLLNTAEHRTAETRKNFQEALVIYREFAARAPATYRSEEHTSEL